MNGHRDASSASQAPPAWPYWLTWLALLALQGLSLGSAFLPLGPFNLVLNIGIAVVMVLLVLVVLMHLNHARAVIRIAAVAGFLFLGLLLWLMLADYLTRPS
jgi:cytochrome c oxidase subunit 4